MTADMTAESQPPPEIDSTETSGPVVVDTQPMPEEHVTDDHQPAPEEVTADPTADLVTLIDALGMTWGAYQLYPDPVSTPAWERAMELFRASEAYPSYAEIGFDSFLLDDVEIKATVDGAARLVRTLFVYEVAAITFPSPPTEGDLLRFFEILQREPLEVARGGGVRALLTNAGVGSVEVVSRGLLDESDDRVKAGRRADVKEIIDSGMTPEELAARIMSQGREDVDDVTERFTSWFESVLGQVQSEDFMGREAIVTIFAEAFFYLPPEFRLSILEYCLASRSKPAFQYLLDQFSGHELAELSHDLSVESRGQLAEYARVSIDEGRPEELLEMLQPASEVDGARRAVADRIAELLDADGPEVGRGATFARLRAEVAAVPDADGMGRRVLRHLLAAEERDARFRRLLRIWTGKIGRAIHERDLEEAAAWLDAALKDPTYEEGRHGQVVEALEAMATDELITSLIGDVEGGAIPPIAMRLIESWGPRVTRRLVEQLADEEDPARRRSLIDVLAIINRADASELLRQLTDKRWYLVRNLAIALGKTGRHEAAPRLRSLAASHEDHRVRVEALRSLMPISAKQGLAAAIKALRDENKRVRQAAVSLLAAADDGKTDDALVEALNSREVPAEVKVRIVEVLGERATPTALQALEVVARRRSFIGPGRSLRLAAQQALNGVA
jgi:HEAT repeat protein